MERLSSPTNTTRELMEMPDKELKIFIVMKLKEMQEKRDNEVQKMQEKRDTEF